MTRILTMTKSGQRFIFRFQPGNEADVIGEFARLAADPSSIFDWFDAAVLCWQMGRKHDSGLMEELTNP